MGLHICLATKQGDKLVGVPHTDWPAPGWDHARYGWDGEYRGDLWPGDGEPGCYGHESESWFEVFDAEDDTESSREHCFRPTPERLKLLRTKYPNNPRCQRLVDLLEADESMMVFII